MCAIDQIWLIRLMFHNAVQSQTIYNTFSGSVVLFFSFSHYILFENAVCNLHAKRTHVELLTVYGFDIGKRKIYAESSSNYYYKWYTFLKFCIILLPEERPLISCSMFRTLETPTHSKNK